PFGFQVYEDRNHFMGPHINMIDPVEANYEWQALRTCLEHLGCMVTSIDGRDECPDMVFAANAALAVSTGGIKVALMSRMVYPERESETPHYEAFLRERGYHILEALPEDVRWEGQGDALWHPGKMFLWGGYGPRSTKTAYKHIAKRFNVPVALLRLVSPLYHLDTAFCPLDQQTVLYCPDAFDVHGREMIDWAFSRQVKVTREFAMRTFCCNAKVLGKHVILPEGAEEIHPALKACGFEPMATPMREYMKSGGAVRCCLLDAYP
ncbi:MAG: arginine deiminase-related protein, partial [Nitrososphaera sp.]|nr:arginine deiminase-related protein [Nitrososphaera sp.]